MSAPARRVTCPVCLDTFAWDDSELLQYSAAEGKYSPVELPDTENQAKIDDARKRLYVRCPNPSGDSGSHYLPATYVDYGDPLVIATIGRPAAGKTHLVVAMVRELLAGAASGAGLRARALDHYRHLVFLRDFLNPFEAGMQLPGTTNGIGTYLTWLVVEHGKTRRPLVLFDVAGEDFRSDESKHTRFLVNAGALLFVEDAPHVVRSAAEEQDLHRDRSLGGIGPSGTNEYFAQAIERLPDGGRGLPAALALTKADRLRYFAPVDRWLREEPTGLTPDRLLAETRDIYALLHSVGATSAMRLYNDFERCTMHFVSATGGAASGQRYPAGIRPARALTPLLALLAMAGVITGPDAERVGR